MASRAHAGDRRGLEDLELIWLAGLFSAAELAAADLLLQLSVAGGLKAASTTPTSSTSPRSAASSCCGCAEDKEEVEQVVVDEETAPASTEELLDRRATKRYRLLSDLYAATSPVTSASASASAANKSKRLRRRHGHVGDEVRGGDC